MVSARQMSLSVFVSFQYLRAVLSAVTGVDRTGPLSEAGAKKLAANALSQHLRPSARADADNALALGALVLCVFVRIQIPPTAAHRHPQSPPAAVYEERE